MEGFILVGLLGCISVIIGSILFIFQENKCTPVIIGILGFCLAYISFAYVNHLDDYKCELKIEFQSE